jgi:hypothetical protein
VTTLSSAFDDVADTVLLAGDRGGLPVPEVNTGGDTPLFLGCWLFEDSRPETLQLTSSVALAAGTGDQAELCFFVGFGAGNG